MGARVYRMRTSRHAGVYGQKRFSGEEDTREESFQGIKSGGGRYGQLAKVLGQAPREFKLLRGHLQVQTSRDSDVRAPHLEKFGDLNLLELTVAGFRKLKRRTDFET